MVAKTRSPQSTKRCLETFQENEIIALSIDDQWDVDLIDMSKYSKENDGIAFVLVVIDIFFLNSYVCNLFRTRKAKMSLQLL